MQCSLSRRPFDLFSLFHLKHFVLDLSPVSGPRMHLCSLRVCKCMYFIVRLAVRVFLFITGIYVFPYIFCFAVAVILFMCYSV